MRLLIYPLLLVGSLHAQSTARWEVVELPFRTERTPQDSFGTTFGALFQHPDGRQMEVPGFYDGEGTYRIRFCPPDAGTWRYTTYASEPELSGRLGQLAVTAGGDKRGPVIIDPDHPKRFRYADGSPAFINSFELDWLFALDYENETDIPRTRALVDSLQAHGVNQLILNVYAYDAEWGEKDKIKPEHNFARPAAFPWGGSNETPDHSRLNLTFFQRLDRVIQYLDEREMLAHLMIYVWNKQVSWPELGSPADDHYFEQVVKRYQAYPNVLWNFGKEALSYGYCDTEYVAMRMRQLYRLDAHRRLKTVHDFHFFEEYPELVDYVAIQSWTANLYDQMRLLQEAFPQKPVFNIEHGGYVRGPNDVFTGSYTDPVVCLERNYLCAFAGAYSNYYWQNMAWYQIIYDPWKLPAGEQPPLDHIRHMTDFFTGQDYNSLEYNPDFSVGYSMVNADSTHYLFLMPAGGQVRGGMGPSFRGKRLSVQYFDPLTGRYSEVTERTQKSGWLSLESPEDWSTDHFRVAILNVLSEVD